MLYRKAKLVIEYIALRDVDVPDITQCYGMTHVQLNECFEKGWAVIKARIDNDRADLAYTTLCNKIADLMSDDAIVCDVIVD